MKTITLNKGQIVKVPAENQKDEGAVAFQVIEFVINFFGTEIITTHDTRITEDGKQFVIGGCGFIKDGFEVVA